MRALKEAELRIANQRDRVRLACALCEDNSIEPNRSAYEIASLRRRLT